MTPKQSKMKILTRKFAAVLLASHQRAAARSMPAATPAPGGRTEHDHHAHRWIAATLGGGLEGGGSALVLFAIATR
jgi:hypothetical protein